MPKKPKSVTAATAAALADYKPPSRWRSFPPFDDVIAGWNPDGDVPGIRPKSLILLVGMQGVGKSSLALQIAHAFTEKNSEPAIYAAIDMGKNDMLEYCVRLKCASDRLHVIDDDSIYTIFDKAKETRAKFVVIDSLSTVMCDDVSAASGSAKQMNAVVNFASDYLRGHDMSIIFIAHPNRSGNYATTTVEHMIDALVLFDFIGDDKSFDAVRDSTERLLSTEKNRHGKCKDVPVKLTPTGFAKVEIAKKKTVGRVTLGE